MARKFISRAEGPLGTFSYQTSSRCVEIRFADWPEKYFSGRSKRRSGRVILSCVFFHRSIGKISVRSFRKKRFDEAEEIVNRNMGASNDLPSIFLTDLSKVCRKTHECRVFLKNRNKFVLQIKEVSVLSFLVARKAS